MICVNFHKKSEWLKKSFDSQEEEERPNQVTEVVKKYSVLSPHLAVDVRLISHCIIHINNFKTKLIL